MGLFKKLFSILQGDSEEKDIENLSLVYLLDMTIALEILI